MAGRGPFSRFFAVFPVICRGGPLHAPAYPPCGSHNLLRLNSLWDNSCIYAGATRALDIKSRTCKAAGLAGGGYGHLTGL